MTSPLPLRVCPAPRETIFSFVGRMAAVNRLDTASFCQDMGVPLRSLSNFEPKAVDKVADIAGLSHTQIAELMSWTGRPLKSVRIEFRGAAVVSRAVRNPDVYGCPICLRDDAASSEANPLTKMVLRGEFLFRHSQTCSKDGHPLVMLWSDKNPTRRYLADQMSSLIKPLSNSTFERAFRTQTAYDKWLIARLETGDDETWLSCHTPHVAATICRLIGRQLLLTDRLLDNVPPADRDWQCYSLGFETISGNERDFRAVLVDLVAEKSGGLGGAASAFGDLYRDLSTTLSYDTAFDPFRDILRDVILDQWPIKVGEVLLGQVQEKSRLHSVASAAGAFGLHPDRMRLVLAAEDIISDNDPRSDARLTFPATALEGLSTKLSGLVDLATLRDRFNVTEFQFISLRREKLFAPTLDRRRARSAWDPEPFACFLKDMFRNSVNIVAQDNGWEQIHDASVRAGIAVTLISNAVREGAISVGRLHGVNGYAALFVSSAEVDRLRVAVVPEGQSPFVFGQSVGITSKGTMQALFDSGQMPATLIRDSRSGKTRHRVTQADADAFQAKFVTLRTGAAAFGIQKRILKFILENAGVRPFAFEDVCFEGIYLRRDVEAAVSASGKSL
ncbi:TniQ family protein [Loktanella salsilacus]|uniref:TniQ family protein n=1 Tax=Loktanella salsilacus TaxID=195913 RepID=UPI0020B894ED|nr:TniQ family protein [Loktanella salsilacus]UTH48905.1 TniQ family protein [Loktanella salsilacus]